MDAERITTNGRDALRRTMTELNVSEEDTVSQKTEMNGDEDQRRDQELLTGRKTARVLYSKCSYL